jgi:uncharacterized membrane protein HdeD (DUF308 family)
MSDKPANDRAKAGWIGTRIFGLGFIAIGVWVLTTGPNSVAWAVTTILFGIGWLVRGYFLWRAQRPSDADEP